MPKKPQTTCEPPHQLRLGENGKEAAYYGSTQSEVDNNDLPVLVHLGYTQAVRRSELAPNMRRTQTQHHTPHFPHPPDRVLIMLAAHSQ
eukprot:3760883-Prymnesium_polylepis.1